MRTKLGWQKCTMKGNGLAYMETTEHYEGKMASPQEEAENCSTPLAND